MDEHSHHLTPRPSEYYLQQLLQTRSTSPEPPVRQVRKISYVSGGGLSTNRPKIGSGRGEIQNYVELPQYDADGKKSEGIVMMKGGDEQKVRKAAFKVTQSVPVGFTVTEQLEAQNNKHNGRATRPTSATAAPSSARGNRPVSASRTRSRSRSRSPTSSSSSAQRPTSANRARPASASITRNESVASSSNSTRPMSAVPVGPLARQSIVGSLSRNTRTRVDPKTKQPTVSYEMYSSSSSTRPHSATRGRPNSGLSSNSISLSPSSSSPLALPSSTYPHSHSHHSRSRSRSHTPPPAPRPTLESNDPNSEHQRLLSMQALLRNQLERLQEQITQQQRVIEEKLSHSPHALSSRNNNNNRPFSPNNSNKPSPVASPRSISPSLSHRPFSSSKSADDRIEYSPMVSKSSTSPSRRAVHHHQALRHHDSFGMPGEGNVNLAALGIVDVDDSDALVGADTPRIGAISVSSRPPSSSLYSSAFSLNNNNSNNHSRPVSATSSAKPTPRPTVPVRPASGVLPSSGGPNSRPTSAARIVSTKGTVISVEDVPSAGSQVASSSSFSRNDVMSILNGNRSHSALYPQLSSQSSLSSSSSASSFAPPKASNSRPSSAPSSRAPSAPSSSMNTPRIMANSIAPVIIPIKDDYMSAPILYINQEVGDDQVSEDQSQQQQPSTRFAFASRRPESAKMSDFRNIHNDAEIAGLLDANSHKPTGRKISFDDEINISPIAKASKPEEYARGDSTSPFGSPSESGPKLQVKRPTIAQSLAQAAAKYPAGPMELNFSATAQKKPKSILSNPPAFQIRPQQKQ